MVSLLPFGNVLVPATVLFSGGEFINLALYVRILDNHFLKKRLDFYMRFWYNIGRE
jgi:hypothetical protein